MSDWFQVPLEDVHRVVSKPLLHCLGCVRRVIVMLEGELSAPSEVLSALSQDFIKYISVFSCIQLSFFSDHFPSPCHWKTPPLYDAAATMLHRWDGIVQVISSAWFSLDKNEVHQNSSFFHSQSYLGIFFINSNQGFMYLYWGEAWVWSLWPRSVDVCPSVSFSIST